MKNAFALLFIITISSINVSAQTNVSGDVSGTWSKANSPYHLTGNVTIPNGKTLTIESGVEIEAKGWYGLFVDGRLLCNGKEGDMIKFHSNFKDGWQGIRFEDTDASNDTSVIKFVEISDGNQPRNDAVKNGGNGGALLIVETNKVKVANCNFHHNKAKRGGALFIIGKENDFVDVKIENCVFENNESYELTNATDGGAASIVYSDVELINCQIISNESNGRFGGISFFGGNPKMTNCTIKDNFSDDGTHAKGGGIGCEFGTNLKLTYCEIVNNYSTGQGGGIFVDEESSIEIRNSRIDSNCVRSTVGIWGNAVHLESKNTGEFHSCTFGANGFINKNYSSSTTIYNNGGTLVFVDCKVQNNYGSSFRVFRSGDVEAHNSIFANNTIGSALIDSDGNFFNCNFVNNHGRFFAGSASMFAQSSDPKFYNCIFYGNKDTTGDLANIWIYNSSADPTFVNCIIEGGKDKFIGDGAGANYGGTYQNNLEVDPMFTNPTSGVGVNFAASKADWSLKNTCGAISAGHNKGTSVLPTGFTLSEVDLAGNPRVAVDSVDIGAYEIQIPKDRAIILSEFGDSTNLCEGADEILKMEYLASKPTPLWYTSTDGQNWKFYSTSDSTGFLNVDQSLNGTLLRGHITADCGLSDTFYTVLKVVESPVVGIADTVFNCSQNGALVSNESHQADYLYRWSDNSNEYPKTFNPSNSENQTVEVTNANGCSSSKAFLISNVDGPNFSLGEDVSITGTGTTTLNGPTGDYTYEWNTGETTSNIEVKGVDYAKGSYDFWVDVTDQNGCTSRDSIVVNIGTDGVNEVKHLKDAFYPNPLVGGDLSKLTLSDDYQNEVKIVTTLYGEVLFETNSSKLQGHLPSGIYIIKILKPNAEVVGTAKLVVTE